MKKILILLTGLMIFIINVTFGTDCITNQKPLHTHDTTNVSHQFYDALVETPKDALIKGGVATKDLAVAATELVIEAPIKTLAALKNGTLKTLIATKNGITKAYQLMVKKPLIIAKEAVAELNHRLQLAGHTLAHGHDHEEHEHFYDLIADCDEIYIVELEDAASSYPATKQIDAVQIKTDESVVTIIIAWPDLVQTWAEDKSIDVLSIKSTHEECNEAQFLLAQP